MSPWRYERVLHGAFTTPQCSPGAFWHRAANRYGDFARSRGETSDRSKAEDLGLLPHVLPPHAGSANVFHNSFVDSRGGGHKYKKTSNGLFVNGVEIAVNFSAAATSCRRGRWNIRETFRGTMPRLRILYYYFTGAFFIPSCTANASAFLGSIRSADWR